MRTVRFIQTAHHEGDDRVTYHQIPTLREAGYDVSWEHEACDYAICDTPKAVLEARRLGAKVILYDVTEWYPSKKNLRGRGWKKPFYAVAMVGMSLIAGCVADRFIFGEADKAKPFRILFPWKRHVFLPYYPKTEYIRRHQARDLKQECRLFYAGPKTREKGYTRVCEVLKRCQALRPETNFVLDVIDSASGFLPLEAFCERVAQADIALDLRARDTENRRCLPIKWFYYAASGVPSIYTDLDALRKQVPEATSASALVSSTDEAVETILGWIDHRESYLGCQEAGHKAHEEKYNWDAISARLLQILG